MRSWKKTGQVRGGLPHRGFHTNKEVKRLKNVHWDGIF